MTTLLVDGDVLVYRCGFAVEKTRYLLEVPGDWLRFDSAVEAREATKGYAPDEVIQWTRKTIEPVQNALFLVKNAVDKVVEKYAPDHLEIYLTPPIGNFREQIAKTLKYKGNRDAQQKPKHFKEIVKYLIEEHGALYADGMEADDALGIRNAVLDDAIMVSVDKDLDQLPGLHYNWVKDEEYRISKKEGTINFYSQVLSGDATDNIQGLTGVGPVTARKMLAACASSRDCWEVVLGAYRGEFGDRGEERAVENAQLCWVRRKDGEVWTPPAGS